MRRHHANTNGLYTWTTRLQALGSATRKRANSVGDVPLEESDPGAVIAEVELVPIGKVSLS